jgi:leucine dehydrogenase
VQPLRELGATIAAADEIHQLECEVYSPCALGAVVRPETIGRLRCRVVAGAANNQLADASMGDELKRRGIVYAPDFAINAGGVINIADELIGDGYDPQRAQLSVERIGQTLRDVFERARAAGVAPNRAAEQMARERITAARAADPVR